MGEGSVLVNQSGDTLNEIVDSVKRVNAIIGEISTSSQEQSDGVGTVNQAISNMDQMTQKNAALAEEATAASLAMSGESETLNKLIAFFELGPQLAAHAAEEDGVPDFRPKPIPEMQMPPPTG